MCTSSMLFMGSKNLRLPSFMLLVLHQVWCLALVLDLWQIFGEEGEKIIQKHLIIFLLIRKMAIAFSVIYTFCCLTKLSPNFWWLFVGRLFGGIATSMLFSTFESWYVYEHSERHGFPSEWIGITFSLTTFWNGIIAIVAGKEHM
jgi:MFS family permease